MSGIDAVPAAAWDALVPAGQIFQRHAFLSLLERSQSVGERAGWQPRHLVIEDDGRPIAAAPLYLKSNSQGEYVYDHPWAEAVAKSGRSYYPKLQSAVPFTPVPGARLLAADPAARARLATLVPRLVRDMKASSFNVTFCDDEDASLLEAHGFIRRRDIQFHWHNHAYRSFDDFLATMRSDRRVAIRRERALIARSGLSIDVLEGREAASALESFHALYCGTITRRRARAYLTATFFQRLGHELPNEVLVVRARRGGQMVAAALHLLAGDTLHTRLWGAAEEVRFLHFECCYYRVIEHAIERGLRRVEGGAEGTHKLMRGYAPTWTHSAHWIEEPSLRTAVAHFVEREREHRNAQFEELRRLLPYRSDTAPGAG